MWHLPGRFEALSDEAGEPVVTVDQVVRASAIFYSRISCDKVEQGLLEAVEVLEQGFGRKVAGGTGMEVDGAQARGDFNGFRRITTRSAAEDIDGATTGRELLGQLEDVHVETAGFVAAGTGQG
jgi:hypothetical protein